MALADLELAHQYETVKLLRRGPEAWVVLDRPDSLNGWVAQTGDDLQAAFEVCASDDSIRVVVISGEGRAFSSGADLKQGLVFQTPEGKPDVQKVLREHYHAVFVAMRALPKPIIAAVNGACVGVGMGFALAADQVVMKRSSYLLLAFAGIGLAPDGGTSVFVPARIGYGRSFALAALAEKLPADEALAIGLADRVHDDEEFDAEVGAFAARLAAGPTRAYAAIKAQLNASLYPHLEQQLDLEAELQQQMAETDDFMEGVGAFLQKRSASFQGK